MPIDLTDFLVDRMAGAQKAMNQNLAERIYGDDWMTAHRKPEPKMRRFVRRVRGAIGDAMFKATCFVAGEDRWTGDW